jgi:hypothetical protein
VDQPVPDFGPGDETRPDVPPGMGPVGLAEHEQMAGAVHDGAAAEPHQRAALDKGAPEQAPRATVPSRWTDLCPYLLDETGTWRATRPTKEHRCMALNPPAPLRADKQRRHCLVAAHVECPIYVAAREVRSQTVGQVGDVGDVDDPSRTSRRRYARTAPVILERPAAAAVAVSAVRTSLPQVGLIVLMLLAVAALLLARFVSP